MKQEQPELAPFIDEGLYWVEMYFEKTDSTRAYFMAIGETPVLDTSHTYLNIF